MPKRRPLIDTHAPEGTEEILASRTDLRTARKLTQQALDALAKLLVSLPARTLAALALDPALDEAVRLAVRLDDRGAKGRQMRLVAKMLREHDVEGLHQRALVATGATTDDGGRAQRLEHWRTRLLAEGDDALAELLVEHPGADRQRVRTAVRAAVAERAEGKSTRRAKALYQVLKELGDPVPREP